MKNIGYQFVAVPLNLFYCLDNNLRSMLFTLIQMSNYKKKEAIKNGKKWDDWFLAANYILAANSNLSENLVRVTLDALYQNGIISIQSEGKGKGRNTSPNKIKINWERFKDFEKESIDDCIRDPSMKIKTPPYKGSNYQPSYLKQDRVVRTEPIMIDDEVNNEVNDLVEDLVKSEDNIYNIDNINNKNNIYNKDNICNNSNIINNDFPLTKVEESLGDSIMDRMIEGFSKTNDVESIVNQYKKIDKRLNYGHLSKDIQWEYMNRIGQTIFNRCEELGIDSTIVRDRIN